MNLFPCKRLRVVCHLMATNHSMTSGERPAQPQSTERESDSTSRVENETDFITKLLRHSQSLLKNWSGQKTQSHRHSLTHSLSHDSASPLSMHSLNGRLGVIGYRLKVPCHRRNEEIKGKLNLNSKPAVRAPGKSFNLSRFTQFNEEKRGKSNKIAPKYRWHTVQGSCCNRMEMRYNCGKRIKYGRGEYIYI